MPLPVIAIGVRGGKIVGYGSGHTPIYAGSAEANKLALHAGVAHSAPDLAKMGQSILDWLKTLGIDAKSGNGHIGVSAAVGKQLAAAFHVKPEKNPAGKGDPNKKLTVFRAHDLLTHVGKPLPAKEKKAPPTPKEVVRATLAPTGWPQTKGGVTVHAPGGPPPPNVAWGAYPGPGYRAVLEFKGKTYGIHFDAVDGRFAGKVVMPDGVEVPCTSPNHASNLVMLNSKGLPYDLNSYQLKQAGIAYPANRLFKFKEFQADLQAAGSAPTPTLASKDVQTLEKEGLVAPEKKTLSVGEMLATLPDGPVTDPAFLPAEVQRFLAEARELPSFTQLTPGMVGLLPGTVWKGSTPVGVALVFRDAGLRNEHRLVRVDGSSTTLKKIAPAGLLALAKEHPTLAALVGQTETLKEKLRASETYAEAENKRLPPHLNPDLPGAPMYVPPAIVSAATAVGMPPEEFAVLANTAGLHRTGPLAPAEAQAQKIVAQQLIHRGLLTLEKVPGGGDEYQVTPDGRKRLADAQAALPGWERMPDLENQLRVRERTLVSDLDRATRPPFAQEYDEDDQNAAERRSDWSREQHTVVPDLQDELAGVRDQLAKLAPGPDEMHALDTLSGGARTPLPPARWAPAVQSLIRRGLVAEGSPEDPEAVVVTPQGAQLAAQSRGETHAPPPPPEPAGDIGVGLMTKLAQVRAQEQAEEAEIAATTPPDPEPTAEELAEPAPLTEGPTASSFSHDIPLETAIRAHSGTSFVPEKRGESFKQGYGESMAADYAALLKHATTPEKKATLDAEFARFRAAYRDKTLAWLRGRAGAVSSMIAGPSNFPARRQNKRAEAEHKKLTELVEFRENALKRIHKEMHPELQPIMAGASDATQRLQEKLALLERTQDTMKKVNAAVRKHKKDPEAGLAAVMALGVKEETARKLLRQTDMNGQPIRYQGFEPWQLTNASAEIRRLKARIEQVTKDKAAPLVQTEGTTGVRLEDSPADNRVRLFFPGKPSEEERAKLKRNGFRWTPSLGCWQAYRNPAAMRHAKEVAGVTEIAAPAPKTPPVLDIKDVQIVEPSPDGFDRMPDEVATTPVATENGPARGTFAHHVRFAQYAEEDAERMTAEARTGDGNSGPFHQLTMAANALAQAALTWKQAAASPAEDPAATKMAQERAEAASKREAALRAELADPVEKVRRRHATLKAVNQRIAASPFVPDDKLAESIRTGPGYELDLSQEEALRLASGNGFSSAEVAAARAASREALAAPQAAVQRLPPPVEGPVAPPAVSRFNLGKQPEESPQVKMGRMLRDAEAAGPSPEALARTKALYDQANANRRARGEAELPLPAKYQAPPPEPVKVYRPVTRQELMNPEMDTQLTLDEGQRAWFRGERDDDGDPIYDGANGMKYPAWVLADQLLPPGANPETTPHVRMAQTQAIPEVMSAVPEVQTPPPAPVQTGLPGIRGRSAPLYVPAAEGGAPEKQRAHYVLVEADSLVASHQPDKGFLPHARYPEKLQTRDYQNDKGNKMKVEGLANRLVPELVWTPSVDAMQGPPVVTQDGVVLGGNGRTMGIQMAYARGGEKADESRAYLREHAGTFGFTEAQVAALKNPMVVRQVELPGATHQDLQDLVHRYNESNAQGMSAKTSAVAEARRMTDATMNHLAAIPEDSTLNEFLDSDDSLPFVSALRDAGVLTQRNASALLEEDGLLNEDGRQLVSRILTASLVPDAQALEKMGSSLRNTLARSSPYILAASAESSPEWDLRPAVLAATLDIIGAKKNGIKSAADFLSQGSMFGPPNRVDSVPLGREMLTAMWNLGKKPVVFAKVMRAYLAAARSNPAGQAGMFAAEMPAPATVLTNLLATMAKSEGAEDDLTADERGEWLSLAEAIFRRTR